MVEWIITNWVWVVLGGIGLIGLMFLIAVLAAGYVMRGAIQTSQWLKGKDKDEPSK